TPVTTTSVSVSTAEPSTPPTTTTTSIKDEDLTIAQTLMKLRNHELAEILQAKEQGELTIEERSKLFVELMNERKKQFVKLRGEKKRRKPPKSSKEESNVVEGIGKKAESNGKEAVSKMRERKGLDEESIKRQKLEDDAKKEEIKACLYLDKLIKIQITDNNKKGLGYVSYNVVPSPHTGRFLPLRIDLFHTGLQEFAEPSVQSYGVKPIKVVTQKSSVKISDLVKENNGAPLIEDWESNEEDEIESPPEKERKTVKPSVEN
nr:hypothetical protein [Tanacetum cinerariifolium]